MLPADVPPDARLVMQTVSQYPPNEVNVYAKEVDGKVEMYTTETNPPQMKPLVILVDGPNLAEEARLVAHLSERLNDQVVIANSLPAPSRRVPTGIIGHVSSSKLAILSLLGALGAKGQQALMVRHEEPPGPTPEQLRRRMVLMDNDEPFATHGDGDTRGRKAYNKSKRPRWRQ